METITLYIVRVDNNFMYASTSKHHAENSFKFHKNYKQKESIATFEEQTVEIKRAE